MITYIVYAFAFVGALYLVDTFFRKFILRKKTTVARYLLRPFKFIYGFIYCISVIPLRWNNLEYKVYGQVEGAMFGQRMRVTDIQKDLASLKKRVDSIDPSYSSTSEDWDGKGGKKGHNIGEEKVSYGRGIIG